MSREISAATCRLRFASARRSLPRLPPKSVTLKTSGREAQRVNERKHGRSCRAQTGFVLQHVGLIPALTVAENIAMPAQVVCPNGLARIDKVLACIGLSHRRTQRAPLALRGRDAARRLCQSAGEFPATILADDPTGDLDSASGDSIITPLRKLHDAGVTSVVVIHNESIANAGRPSEDCSSGWTHRSPGGIDSERVMKNKKGADSHPPPYPIQTLAAKPRSVLPGSVARLVTNNISLLADSRLIRATLGRIGQKLG